MCSHKQAQGTSKLSALQQLLLLSLSVWGGKERCNTQAVLCRSRQERCVDQSHLNPEPCKRQWQGRQSKPHYSCQHVDFPCRPACLSSLLRVQSHFFSSCSADPRLFPAPEMQLQSLPAIRIIISIGFGGTFILAHTNEPFATWCCSHTLNVVITRREVELAMRGGARDGERYKGPSTE